MPLWETLVTEMRKAKDRNLPFDFGHYIMICKLFKSEAEDEGPEAKQVRQTCIPNWPLALSNYDDPLSFS